MPLKLAPEAQVKFEEAKKNPEHQGYLEKRGEKHKSWNKRWCILKDNFIFYAKNLKAEAPQGIVNLIGCTVEKVDLRPPRSHCFTVLSSKSVSVEGKWSNRKYWFVADSSEELFVWINIIQKAIDRAKGVKGPPKPNTGSPSTTPGISRSATQVDINKAKSMDITKESLQRGTSSSNISSSTGKPEATSWKRFDKTDILESIEASSDEEEEEGTSYDSATPEAVSPRVESKANHAKPEVKQEPKQEVKQEVKPEVKQEIKQEVTPSPVVPESKKETEPAPVVAPVPNGTTFHAENEIRALKNMIAALQETLAIHTQEIKQLQQMKVTCTVCKNRDISRCIDDCKHACLCEECAKQQTMCPVCQAAITATFRIFLPIK